MKKITNALILLLTVWLITKNTAAKAQCTANINAFVGAGGTVTFSCLATGTNASTTYDWDFDDGTTVNGLTTNTCSHTYSAAAVYRPRAGVSTGTCTAVDSSVYVPVSTAPCVVNSSFSYTQSINGFFGFTDNSIGNQAIATWDFGDGSPVSVINYSSFIVPNLSISHTYTANGIYTVSLIASSNYTPCNSISTQTISVTSVTSPCTLGLTFNSIVGSGGLVNFTATATGTTASSNYIWNFGDGFSSNTLTNPNATHTYTNPGTYTVDVTFVSGNCVITYTNTVFVPPTTPCNLVASFNSSFSGIVGIINFTSTSTGLLPGAYYMWSFGNSTNLNGTNQTSGSASYPSNGTYIATLTVSNYSTCTSTYTQAIVVANIPSSPCNLTASFSASVGINGNTSFVSTSAGTVPGANYIWSFGNSLTSNGLSTAQTTYVTNGTYIATLTVVNNSVSCFSSYTQAIVVSNATSTVPCNLTANYIHIVGSGGSVNFNSISTNTNATSTFIWDFGDGISSSGSATSHTYISAGSYNVKLLVNNLTNPTCKDSVVQAINITGIPCVANANFTTVPTATPQVWNAIPAYPWNVSAASWSWGDGSSSNTLYASHNYAAAGTYTICLTVTVSCGSSTTSCMYPYIYKSANSEAQQMISINVVKPQAIPASITESVVELTGLSVYPNPSSGMFSVDLSALNSSAATIIIYDALGHILYNKRESITNGNLHHDISIDAASNGLYFLKVSADTKTSIRKIIIDK